MSRDAIHTAAERLRYAERTREPCAPVRDLLGPVDVLSAYAVQDCNVRFAESEGRQAVGWKIGLTSPAVQAQLGVDQPDFGVLFADREVPVGGAVDPHQLLQPKAEAEIIFVLEADLPDRPLRAADVIRATDFIAAGIEIVDSRVKDWDITIVDTVADNASSGLYVLGPRPVSLRDLDLQAVPMEFHVDGDVASTGSGAACLGHPLNAVVWLANTAREVGRPLRAGDVVLSGALGPMVSVGPGAHCEAVLDGLGSVSIYFERDC